MEGKNIKNISIEAASKVMEKKLRVLAFSDVHGDRKLISQLHRKAEEEDVDLVLICGDFTDFSEEVTPGFIQKFLDAKKPVAIVSGNHESTGVSEVLADILNTRASVIHI